MNDNAVAINPQYPTGNKSPFYYCINLSTLDETEWTNPGYFDFDTSEILGSTDDGEPDYVHMGELVSGLEAYVIKGTEASQTNGIYNPDVPRNVATIIRMLRNDLADEDWANINFRLVYWLGDNKDNPDDNFIGWSILLTDLNDAGLLRQLETAYDAVNDAENGAYADGIIDALSDNVDDVDRVRDLYARLLAEKFGVADLPQEALDMIYNRGVSAFDHAMHGRDECFSETMYNAFADYTEFLNLATGKDID